MPFLIRAWEDRDTGLVKGIQHAVYPGYHSPPVRRWQAASQWNAPSDKFLSYIALDEESSCAAAYAALWNVRPRKLRFDLMVHPDHQRRGLGSMLLSRLLTGSVPHQPETIQARVRDDHSEAIAFLSHRGFSETQRMYGLELTVADFRFSDWAHLFDRLAHRGITITTMEQARNEDEAWLPKLHEMYCAAAPDWPDPDPDLAGFTPLPMTDFRRRVETEFTRPDAFFIARDSRRYIGASSILAFGTAVHPEYRQLGVATALKAMGILFAQRQGMDLITTCTASPAMRAANQKVGFRHYSTEIRLVRSF